MGYVGHTEPREARTLVDSVHRRLREDILSGALPPGSKLRVEVLKDRYAVGTSTLREALSLLVSDTLVTSEGQRGFRVAPTSVEDLRDITRMRKMLEAEAVRQAIELGDDQWEAGVVAAYHRLSRIEERLRQDPDGLGGEWEARNREFHEALIAACPSHWLRHFRGILYSQSERYRRLALTTRSESRDVHAEHEAIYRAVLNRDADTAAALLGEHIDRTLAVLTPVLESARE